MAFGPSSWEQGFTYSRDGRELPAAPDHWSSRACGMYENGYLEGCERGAGRAKGAGYFVRKVGGRNDDGFYAARPDGVYIAHPGGGSVWPDERAAWRACATDHQPTIA